ncbi:MAG: ABC transporter permease [Filifactor alocis]|nr:ABC transporter permease [Filifactor alocis]
MVKRRGKKWLSKIYTLLMYLFLYLPILVMIVFSFNDSKYKGHWEGFTLRWYEELFQDKEILSAVYTTFIVAILAAIISTIFGTATAVALSKLKPRYKNLLLNLSYIPMVNPDIVIGISLLSLFVFLKMELGYVTLILAHITFNIPYVIFAVLPKIGQLDKNLEEAALDLGATPVQAFFKVIFPELLPGIMTGFMLSFTMSLDDFIVSFFTTGSGVATLSIKIFSMTKRGVSPKINALSSILFVLTVLIVGFSQWKNRKDEKARAKLVLK